MKLTDGFLDLRYLSFLISPVNLADVACYLPNGRYCFFRDRVRIRIVVNKQYRLPVVLSAKRTTGHEPGLLRPCRRVHIVVT